jgi:hypothetical protein
MSGGRAWESAGGSCGIAEAVDPPPSSAADYGVTGGP